MPQIPFNLTKREQEIIQDTWKQLRDLQYEKEEGSFYANRMENFFDVFYHHLFRKARSISSLFHKNNTKKLGEKLVTMFNFLTTKLPTIESDEVQNEIKDIGKRHIVYGTKPEQFEAWHHAFNRAMEEILGKEIATPEAQKAWKELIVYSAQVMQAGAETANFTDKVQLYREGPSGCFGPKNWYTIYLAINGDMIKISKDAGGNTVYFEFPLSELESVDTANLDKPYCFELSLGVGGSFTFSAAAEETKSKWISELNWRIQAADRQFTKKYQDLYLKADKKEMRDELLLDED